jgi:CBS domain containing-hemolysin-like protein
MNLKASKTVLVILVIALTVLFLADNIMYVKANEALLIQIVDQQNIETAKVMKMFFEKQKELDGVKSELNSLKTSLLTTATPLAVKK